MKDAKVKTIAFGFGFLILFINLMLVAEAAWKNDYRTVLAYLAPTVLIAASLINTLDEP
jgi:hypothetical protein